MGPEGLGAAHDGAEVLGIGEAIDGQQQRRLTDAATTLDQAGQIEGVHGRGLQHDALVHGTAADLAEPGPGDLLHEHTGGLGLPQQLQKAGAEAHLGGAPDAVNRPTALEGGLGGVATPDQIGRSGGGEALGLAPLPIGSGGGSRRAGSAREQYGCRGPDGRCPEGNAPLGLPISKTRRRGAVGAEAIGPAPSLKGGTDIRAAGPSVGRAAPLGGTTNGAPAALPVPAAVGGTVAARLEALAVAGGIGPAFSARALEAASAGLGGIAASITVTAWLRPRGPGPGRAAGRPAEGAVGGISPGTTTGATVGGTGGTALGTASGTAIRGRAHGVRGDGLGGSVFARWSRSSASRRGFRRKSHPSIVSNPVACP